MSDQIINTKRGTFGKVQVTLPLSAKLSIMDWCQKSGLGKAEFFRVALMMGASKLAESINTIRPGEGDLLTSCDRLDVRKPVTQEE
jgi:hypothetical protein